MRARSAAPELVTFAGEAMATDWQVVLPDRPGAAEAAEECFALWRRLDLELSEWKPGSPLSAVNRAAGSGPVAVPPGLFALVERSLALARSTGGAFDPSWAALWDLWDFRGEPRLPKPAAVTARLSLVGWRRVVADPEARTLELPERGMQLGLGAIGKGWALDRAAEILAARGFDDYLLVAGGQVLARGGPRPGSGWRIGLRDPRGAPDELFARVELAEGSLSTSADNERYFELGGRRYHHVLDPRTGWPTIGVRSATVLHREATVADALSTAVMVLGVERGIEVVRRHGAEAVVVDDRGEVSVTPGLERSLERLATPRG